MMRGGDGYAGDELNVSLALRNAPELRDLCRYNEFALQVEFSFPPPWRQARRARPLLRGLTLCKTSAQNYTKLSGVSYSETEPNIC